jgi:hypothetical protein
MRCDGEWEGEGDFDTHCEEKGRHERVVRLRMGREALRPRIKGRDENEGFIVRALLLHGVVSMVKFRWWLSEM